MSRPSRRPGPLRAALLSVLSAAAVLGLAAWGVVVALDVRGLRHDVEQRVALLGATLALQEASFPVSDDEVPAADDLAAWRKAAARFRTVADRTPSQGDADEEGPLLAAARAQIDRLAPLLERAAVDDPARMAEGARLLESLANLQGAVRRANAGLSEALGNRFNSLQWLMGWSLFLALAFLFLLALSGRRERRLESLRAALDESRTRLEERVRSRTADLLRANEDLRREAAVRQRAEVEREGMRQQLLASQRLEAVGRLAGGVAHDFNNLLTAIRGCNELLIQGLAPGHALRSWAELSVQATTRAEALTRQLLAFGRRQAFDPRPVDLPSLVRNLLPLLQRLVGDAVRLDLDAAGPVAAFADPGQVEQVLLNLVANARDALPPGGSIRVRLAREDVDAARSERVPEASPGRWAVLEVVDTGTGIAPDLLPRIFEPFVTTKEAGQGTGLGLAVVYGIVRQHGGWTEVESQVGQGTRFVVHLPEAAEAPAAQEPARREAVPQASGLGSVLVVEDEPGVRRFAVAVLQAAGFRVREAASVAEALQGVEADGPVDLLFSDVVLPDGDGIVVADRLRERLPGLPVLLSSGYFDPMERWPRLREQGYAFLAKPYGGQELRERVRALVDGHAPDSPPAGP